MRRSHRCILKHEIRLASKAEHEAAEAAAAAAPPEAEVPQELTLAVPSTVTKAIAGLATPCLPSPSTFPEDWRMFSELLHDSQVSFLLTCSDDTTALCTVHAGMV